MNENRLIVYHGTTDVRVNSIYDSKTWTFEYELLVFTRNIHYDGTYFHMKYDVALKYAIDRARYEHTKPAVLKCSFPFDIDQVYIDDDDDDDDDNDMLYRIEECIADWLHISKYGYPYPIYLRHNHLDLNSQDIDIFVPARWMMKDCEIEEVILPKVT